MINSIKTLINKTNELEEKINTLSHSQANIYSTGGFASFSKNYINLSFSNLDNFIIIVALIYAFSFRLIKSYIKKNKLKLYEKIN